jgi:DNA mismatch endonuclease (patch repair protein)
VHPIAEASSATVRSRMQRQARRDTRPELQLRRSLHALGLRYRVNYTVPGMSRRTIDIAFTRARVAVFVDGCFWHACPEHATWPRANGEWWEEKLRQNVRRDRETDAHLRNLGWVVVRVWEHAEAHDALGDVVDALPAR